MLDLGWGQLAAVLASAAVKYRFELPPYLTLVARSLTTLEGEPALRHCITVPFQAAAFCVLAPKPHSRRSDGSFKIPVYMEASATNHS